MAGAYCQFCGNRCFVFRVLPDGSWSGHLATCAEGMAHDREKTGHDHTTAVNPAAEPPEWVQPPARPKFAEPPQTRWEMTRGFGSY